MEPNETKDYNEIEDAVLHPDEGTGEEEGVE